MAVFRQELGIKRAGKCHAAGVQLDINQNWKFSCRGHFSSCGIFKHFNHSPPVTTQKSYLLVYHFIYLMAAAGRPKMTGLFIASVLAVMAISLEESYLLFWLYSNSPTLLLTEVYYSCTTHIMLCHYMAPFQTKCCNQSL